LFHEIPHELGDYAVLLSSGFRHCTILVLNTISSACALLAFLIVAALTPGEDVRGWIFCIIAGVFFYIALVNMVTWQKIFFSKVNN
jgi:zinc transporter 12